ncbi:OpgC domain-containing protein [Methylocaldum sp.]|uniref:OpgC family protein n=1 Tax=Methylocaldum sp. TaxID=1969727 RepID=UPI002D6E0152|nr:OpgC domain-containing protein [Methylocaldum sp.]HYE35449.1 OpgC domain-containing protein [Methylocaldum sp.]
MTGQSLHKHRNLKLDFFRGIALLIIFINHVPSNELLVYTPSRFGLSDAAEIFVFLSGYAAAIAYGRSFRTSGLWLGSVRVFYRCAQIYGAHLALFMLLAVICVLGNAVFGEPDYIRRLNLRYFFDDTQEALLGLISLRYVPNYFDILPMYLVVMLWIPVVCALSRVHLALALAFPIGVYLAMWRFGLKLPADLHSDRPWFFNPFGWQLIFFTGFAFGAGWIKPPRRKTWLMAACLIFVILSLPLSPEPALRPTAFLNQLHASLQPWLDKTHLGPLRWLHFLALAYLVMLFLRNRENWLNSKAVRPIVEMGQQSLPIFIVTMALSYVGGIVLDQFGHGVPMLVAVNLGGCAFLLLAARVMAWLKSGPWKLQRENRILPPCPNGQGDLLFPEFTVRPNRLKQALAMVLVGFVAAVPLVLSQRSADAHYSVVAMRGTGGMLAEDHVKEAVSVQGDFK